MSLRAFHIAFIVASVLATLGFAVWAGWQRFAADNGAYTVLGIVSLLIGLALIVYGRAFVRKFGGFQP